MPELPESASNKKQLCRGLNGTQYFTLSSSILFNVSNMGFAQVQNCGIIILPLPYY